METASAQTLKTGQKIGYGVLLALGLLFSLVSIAAFGNILGWLAIVATVGLVGAPIYGLVTKQMITRLPLIAKVVFWLGVLAATCFVFLMTLVVFALRNNFS